MKKIGFLFVNLILLAGVLKAEAFTSGLPGMWSLGATYLWPGATSVADLPEGGRLISIPSPDGRFKIVVKDAHLTVHAIPSGVQLEPDVGAQSLAEVAWSSDSHAFFINESEGGYVGMWTVRAFAVEGKHLRALSPSGLAREHFEKNYCAQGFPNLVAAGWVAGSERLLVVGEVPESSNYRDMGFVRGYLVKANDGQILSQFSSEELASKWHNLVGPRIAETRDQGDGKHTPKEP